MFEDNKKRAWTIGLSIGAILILAVAIFFLFFYSPKIAVQVSPDDADIRLDGQEIAAGQNTKLKTGSHQLTISKDGYIPYTKDFSLKISQVLRLNVVLRSLPETVRMLEEKIAYPVFAYDNKSLLYLGNSGKTIYKLKEKEENKTNEIFAVTPDIFSDLANIVWSPDRNLAVMKNKQEETFLYDFNRYDLLHQEIHQWGKGIGDLIWSPDGEKIVYYYHPDGGEETLIRANRDNTEQERIYNFQNSAIKNPNLVWSYDAKKIILISDKLYLFDIYTKTLEPVSQSEVKEAVFSPSSDKILYRNSHGLFVSDLQGQNTIDLKLDTSIEKTVWFDEKSFLAMSSSSDAANPKLQKVFLDGSPKENYSYKAALSPNPKNLLLSTDKKNLYLLSNDFFYKLALEKSDY